MEMIGPTGRKSPARRGPGQLKEVAKGDELKGRQIADTPHKLLVIETNYSLEDVLRLQIGRSITCRDLGGYFSHVWSVHPFATLVTSESWAPRHGKPKYYKIGQRHTVIEGKVGRFKAMRRLLWLNFLISQLDLFSRLFCLIHREKITVIRVSGPLYAGVFGLALARLCRIPLVVRVGANHDKLFETTGEPLEPRLMRNRRVEKLVERFVFQRADLIAGANQDNLNFALANGARPERATLFRYGNLVDSRHFDAPTNRPKDLQLLRELGVEAGRFLLYVGRLEPMKQPHHVVAAFARLRECGFEVKAVLAGEGRMREELERQARTLGVGEHAVFPGNLGQEQLAQLFPVCAAVVSPHTGRALAEAALGEAPVVAYDVDWQGELIESGRTGVLVPHGDINALTDGLVVLLADRERAKAVGRALRRRALEMLDPLMLDAHEREQYSQLFARFAR